MIFFCLIFLRTYPKHVILWCARNRDFFSLFVCCLLFLCMSFSENVHFLILKGKLTFGTFSLSFVLLSSVFSFAISVTQGPSARPLPVEKEKEKVCNRKKEEKICNAGPVCASAQDEKETNPVKKKKTKKKVYMIRCHERCRCSKVEWNERF